MIRPGTPVSYLSAQGVKVFGVTVWPVREPQGDRSVVRLSSGLIVTIRNDRLTVEK